MVTVNVEQGDIAKVETPAVVANLFEGVTSPRGPTGAVDAATGGAITRFLERGDFRGKLKETQVLYPDEAPFERVLLVGLGERGAFTLDRARQVSARVARSLRRTGVDRFHTIVHGAGVGGLDPRDAAQALAEGAILGLYRFDEFKTGRGRDEDEEDQGEVAEIVVLERSGDHLEAIRAGVARGVTIAESVNHARVLATLSGDAAAPEAIAERIEAIADDAGLACTVHDRAWLEEHGFGGVLAVNRGSAKEPRFVVLEHDPGLEDAPIVVLCGKGITFDTGGISIKPSSNMGRMRFDKAAACAVVGALRAAARLEVPVRVVGLTPFTDNMPDGNAVKPGDVITAFGGTTIEVLNTDAEGRLILADALGYASTFDPDAVIDLATLTGSVTYALGDQAAGLMGTNDELLRRIEAAGEAVHERVWRLPFWDEYDRMLASEVADVQNVAGSKKAGAIVAGKFLARFVGDHPWAHLDVANVSYRKGDGPQYNPEYSPGLANGMGVRLLVRLLEDWTPLGAG